MKLKEYGMTGKRWCLTTAAMLIALLAALIALVAVVDPFEIYHRALFYQPAYRSDTQMYANAGVAKSYAYDSIIVGTSVTENCRPSVYGAALGGSFVKLCMNGGLSRDHAKMMEIAFRTHDVTRVVYGLDLFAFSQYYTNQKAVTPDYLYDDNLLNDVSYVFNKTVLLRYVPDALLRAGTTPDESARDSMYFWNPPVMPSREELLAELGDGALPTESRPADMLEGFTRDNFEQNLLPFIRAHRETTFTVFFPPYSLIYWASQAREGMLDVRLFQRAQLAALLLAEPNVELFDFQARADWTQDYGLYFDSIHYVSAVNDAMAEAMAAGDGRVIDAAQIEENSRALERDCLALLHDVAGSGKELL